MRILRGLYAITPEIPDTDTLCRMAEAALSGGAQAVQYRRKAPGPGGPGDGADRGEVQSDAAAEIQAAALLRVCRRFGRPLIINDSVDLMLAVGAEGVHLGRDDEDPHRARRRIGPGPLIGVSCYDDFERVRRYRDVADQFAFGSLFDSPTKPAAVRAPLGLFAQARALGLNTVGIGGIDARSAGSVAAAGADAIAVISAVFAADDIAAAARDIVAAFERGPAGR